MAHSNPVNLPASGKYVKLYVDWTAASTRANILTGSKSGNVDGEALATSMGKIAKWYTDFKVLTFTDLTTASSGNGNAVTALSYDNATGKLTFTKGSTFLTQHPTITTDTDTTSTASPAHGGTFTAIDSVTRDTNGHVKKVNTKTVTLPAQYSHPTYTRSNTTSTASPAHGETFTAIDSITTNSLGHVTAVNTKTVTLPTDQNTDTKVTQTNTTTDANYRVLFSANANDTTETTTSRKNEGLTFNPGTGVLLTKRLSLKSATAPAITVDLDTLTPTAGQNVNVLTVRFKNTDGTKTHAVSPIAIIGNDATGDTATYNSGVRLGSTNGTTIVAAGESSTAFASAQGKYNDDNLYLVADASVLLYRGMSNDSTTGSGPWTVGGFTATPTSGQVMIADGTVGGYKTSGYTIAKSVPSDAVFTDHITTATTSGSGNAVTAITADTNGALTVTKGSTFSLSNHTHDSLTTKTLTATTLENTAGNFFFGGSNFFGGNYDWVGIQSDMGNDKFQLIAYASSLIFRQNDSGGTNSTNWTNWVNLLTPNAISGTNGITTTITTSTIGSGTSALTYNYGVQIGHSNSVDEVSTESMLKVKYDAHGHIKGSSPFAQDDVNTLINLLSTGSSTPKDADYYISQYANGGTTRTTYHRRPVSALWTYMKGKADSVYAPLSHNHDASDITSGALPIAHGGTGATTRLNALKALTNENVGTSAQYFLTITDSWGKGGYTSVANAKTVLGLGSAAYTESTDYATAGHTHNYAGSSSAGGAATSANKLNTDAGGVIKPVYFSNGVPVACNAPASGAWWNTVSPVNSNGVLEIGRYIDFHCTSASTNNYDVRLDAGASAKSLIVLCAHETDGPWLTVQGKLPKLKFIQTTSGYEYNKDSCGITAYPGTNDAGLNLIMQSGGNTIIGSGEIASTFMTSLNDGDRSDIINYPYRWRDYGECAILASDENAYIWTNGASWDSTKKYFLNLQCFVFNANGNFALPVGGGLYYQYGTRDENGMVNTVVQSGLVSAATTARTWTLPNATGTIALTSHTHTPDEIGSPDIATRGTIIPANSNLNTYTTPGTYYSPDSTRSATITNGPTTGSGYKLYVSMAYSTTRILQYAFGAAAQSQWMRSSGDTGSTWTSWRRLALADSMEVRDGTTSQDGYNVIVLGNSTATGSDNNTYGGIRMYTLGSAYLQFTGHRNQNTLFFKISDETLSNPSLAPNTTNIYDLGTSSYEWKNVYAKTFNENGTSLANKYIPKAGATDISGSLETNSTSAGFIVPGSNGRKMTLMNGAVTFTIGTGNWASGINFYKTSVLGQIGAHGTGSSSSGTCDYFFMGKGYDNVSMRLENDDTGKMTLRGTLPQLKFQQTTSGSTFDNNNSGIIAYPANNTSGMNMTIQSGGNMIIGSGEYPVNFYNASKSNSTTYPDYWSNDGEQMYVGSDNNVIIHTNANTIANRKGFMFTTAGNLQLAEGGGILFKYATSTVEHKLTSAATTTARTWTLPNATGTIALTSNIPATYAGSTTAGGSATTVTITNTENTSEVSKAIPFHDNSTGGPYSLLTNDGLGYRTLNGTASALGISRIVIGNATATGTAGNKYGVVRIYSRQTFYADIQTASTYGANRTFTLPNASGTVALTSNIPGAGSWTAVSYSNMTDAGSLSAGTLRYRNFRTGLVEICGYIKPSALQATYVLSTVDGIKPSTVPRYSSIYNGSNMALVTGAFIYIDTNGKITIQCTSSSVFNTSSNYYFNFTYLTG